MDRRIIQLSEDEEFYEYSYMSFTDENSESSVELFKLLFPKEWDIIF